jgi:hypothetical protein
MKPRKKTPYSERSDASNIRTNWFKALGLFERGDTSACVVRAATCVELAANLVIRKQLQDKHQLPSRFVDKLLKWANGMGGKYQNILLPLFEDTPRIKSLRAIRNSIGFVNDERNRIVHSGKFTGDLTAREIMREARKVVLVLVRRYEKDFDLPRCSEMQGSTLGGPP